MADTERTDDELLKQAAERLRSGDGLPAIDTSDIADFLDDTAEGLPPWGPEDSSQVFALRIARSVLRARPRGSRDRRLTVGNTPSTDDTVTPEQVRAAYDRLRSDASPLPKTISNALVWILGAVVGEDVDTYRWAVDAYGWAPSAFEALQGGVTRAVLDMPAPAPVASRDELAHTLVAHLKPELHDPAYQQEMARHGFKVAADVDASTMVSFLAGDGHRSIRPLTYGEIVDALIATGLVRETSLARGLADLAAGRVQRRDDFLDEQDEDGGEDRA